MWSHHNWISELTREEERLRKKHEVSSVKRGSFFHEKKKKEKVENVLKQRGKLAQELENMRQNFENLKNEKTPKKTRGTRESRRKLLFSADDKSPETDRKVINWMVENDDEEEFQSVPSRKDKGSSKKGGESSKKEGRQRRKKSPSDPSSSDSSDSSDDDDIGGGGSDDSSGDGSDDEKRKKKKKKKQEKTKKKEKKKKKSRKKHKPSSSEDSSDSDSDGVSSINSDDSVGTMRTKAKILIRKQKEELKRNPGQHSLKELKEEVKEVIKRIESHDDLGDVVSTLMTLKRKITKRLDELSDKERKSRQMPKGILPAWDGMHSTYLGFKDAITHCLCYDSEYLNISTLLNQIKGSEKGKITKMLQNEQTLKDIWRVLDRKFGDIDLSQSALLQELDDLKHNPTDEAVENKNIEVLKGYCSLMKNHERERVYIDKRFIWNYSNVLSREHRRKIVEKKLFTSDEFVNFLDDIWEANDLLRRTDKRSKSVIQKQTITNESGFNHSGSRGNSRGRGNRGGNHRPSNGTPHPPYDSNRTRDGQYNSHRGRGAGGGQRRKMVCNLCSKEHTIFRCPEMENKSAEQLKNSGLCIKCLSRNHEGSCSELTIPYLCPSHLTNVKVCGCPKPISSTDAITQNASVVASSFFGPVAFDTEQVTIIAPGGERQVLMTYDSFASQSSVSGHIATELGLSRTNMGSVDIHQYNGVVTGVPTQTVIAGLKELGGTYIQFLVNECKEQILPVCGTHVPAAWRRKYKIGSQYKSFGGANSITLGKDNAHLFPRFVDGRENMVLQKSTITGRYLISGKMESVLGANTGKMEFFNNKSIIKQADSEKFSSAKKDVFMNNKSVINQNNFASQDQLLKHLSTDVVNVAPVKRCATCTGCKECKKSYLPDQERQREQIELIKAKLIYNSNAGHYETKYVYNEQLGELPVYDEACRRMMSALERKLQRENLTQKYNDCVEDFFKRGVLQWTSENASMQNLQKSYIPLTYALRDSGTTKLRICGNSSFKSGKGLSLNDCTISGPNFLANLHGVLLRWRAARSVAIGDISKCYHQIKTSNLDNSLRRTYVRAAGMGTDTAWREAAFQCVSFGDQLGGQNASIAIHDCADRFISEPWIRTRLQSNIYMDDINLPTFRQDEDLDDMVSQVDLGLRRANFNVKDWTKTGDDCITKFLSYNYDAKKDMFSLRVKFNFSPKKRGVRCSPDIQSLEEFISLVREHGLTKRNLASLLAGLTHDPLEIAAPYANNLKLIYRRACRMGLAWDDNISEDLIEKTIRASSLFFPLAKVSFHRKVILCESKKIDFLFYWDGAVSMNGVSIVVKNTLPNGQIVNRLLQNKSRINGADVSTIPRSELAGAHLCSRLYSLICHQLKDFFSSYDGLISYSILGDSEIVLNQLMKMPYLFKAWTGSRLQEIRENVPDAEVNWIHCRTEDNIADILTREHYKDPRLLPWAKFSLPIEEGSWRKLTGSIDVASLPETNRKEIHQNAVVASSMSMTLPQASAGQGVRTPIQTGLPTLQHFLSVETPLVRLEQECAQVPDLHPANEIMTELLQRNNYQATINVIARIFRLASKESIANCQEKANNLIFMVFQMQQADYMKNFRGNSFVVVPSDGKLCTRLIGRDTCYGPTILKLIPHKTLLCWKICEQFHNQCHGSDSFVRADILKHGMYLPQALKILSKYRRRCPTCRKRAQELLVTKMGQIGENRLNAAAPFLRLQSDLIGPFLATEYVNQRKTRKIWLMTNICHFSRFISLTMVENLSKECILKAFDVHSLRYGRAQLIESDMGSNYKSAQKTLEESEEDVDPKIIQELVNDSLSKGTELVIRGPKMPWVMGSVENANKQVKRLIPNKKLSIFNWLGLLEFITHTINRRPIGLSASGLALTPSDMIPIWSKLDPRNMLGATRCLQATMTEFKQKWDELYVDSIKKADKWLKTNHELEVGDIVLIKDLGQAPRLSCIKQILNDTAGTPRYFICQYKIGGKFKEIQRAAQSLCLVLTQKEQKQKSIFDTLMFCDTPKKLKQRKLTVRTNDEADIIVDMF